MKFLLVVILLIDVRGGVTRDITMQSFDTLEICKHMALKTIVEGKLTDNYSIMNNTSVREAKVYCTNLQTKEDVVLLEKK